MSFAGEEVKLTVLLGTTIILLFGVAMISLLAIFSKKSQLNRKEKEIMKATYEKTILQSQLEIQEQTFSVISGELHDNIGQVLSLAKVQLNIINESHLMENEMLNEVKENIGKALADLRDIARGLSSDRIRLLPIYDTVALELERIGKSGVLCTRLTKSGVERPIDDRKKLILFRMIQESIQNCLKHAEATELQASFAFEEEELKVLVSDNGKGFSPLQHSGQDGLGLMNLRRRARLAGGSARVESQLHCGTTISISIPYE
jgi:signal transduction histidine kinase